MISFVLILFCLVPLIYPHLALYKEQTKFTKNIQIDYAVNLLYGELLEALHKRTIPFEHLTESRPVSIPISTETITKAGLDPKSTLYTVSLTAQKENFKGKTGRYIVALVKFIYRFQNINDPKQELFFTYLTPIVKLKPPSEQPAEDNDKNSGNNKQQASKKPPKKAL